MRYTSHVLRAKDLFNLLLEYANRFFILKICFETVFSLIFSMDTA